MVEKKKFSKEKRTFSIEKKIEEIEASKMPTDQKRSYINELSKKTEVAATNKIPFGVYVKIKSVRKCLWSGMLTYPKAVGVKFATIQEWDEIFKGF